MTTADRLPSGGPRWLAAGIDLCQAIKLVCNRPRTAYFARYSSDSPLTEETQAAVQSAPKLLASWVYVPFGITAMLAACFGVSVLFDALGVSFPASVACLILLFSGLLLCELVLGHHKTKAVVAVIDVPAGWSLRWINVLFTPSFIMLPLSPPIGIVEVMKIIAVFIIGFIVMMALAAYLTRGLQLLLGSSKRALTERAEEMGNETDGIPLADTPPRADSAPGSRSVSAAPSSLSLDTLAPPPPPLSHNASHNFLPDASSSFRRPEAAAAEDKGGTKTPPPPPQPPATGSPLPPQIPVPMPRAQVWAAWICGHLSWVIYAAVFVLVGLPVYYAADYAMPLHLSLVLLVYFAAVSVPARWRQYLHPVLVASLFSVLGIWALAAARGDGLPDTLRSFRTGANYTYLWLHGANNRGGSGGGGGGGSDRRRLPGAGDVFGTVLDASIVSLALPMYQYRRELRRNFAAIVVPNVVMSVGCLFSYPRACIAVGISAERSLAFASRSLTLALATPATENLGGDLNTVAAVAIMSGIVGVLFGQRMLAWLRIPEDDYITRGVTLGANSSAIATALLLRTDPRAAALSSLSMSLFGTITVLFTSIPPVADAVRSLVT
ncbi:Plastidal glycolate/glycerate translocator 1, chloroplastic [Colletotrichum tanaceti]|uniref:Plastidal glycolate/glycerate translocator 1, chloroplastic n=1 Tax=Colletotrichum tanaceti TaxID=1306861 RepID=A0A4U6XIT9_9PEZI|nr:Plastidal glycolate/glycerate translocator 1, chloroplastic [Colletotrichum tanaceti]TKW55292.1 Plastidal glycolate/glycerate translocator 1, chloroplastic [Colletotrichum tanaceti]